MGIKIPQTIASILAAICGHKKNRYNLLLLNSQYYERLLITAKPQHKKTKLHFAHI